MKDADRETKMNLARGGDAEAFGELYAEIAPELYRFALWYLKDPHNAEDAVQDACVSAFRNVGSLKKADSFKPWFMRILANRCKDMQVSLARITPVDKLPGPEAEYYAEFSDGYIESFLDRLNEVDRRIVVLSVVADYKSAEIGELLGLGSAAVRKRLSRALQFLRKEMEAEQ